MLDFSGFVSDFRAYFLLSWRLLARYWPIWLMIIAAAILVHVAFSWIMGRIARVGRAKRA